ncbi:hypothetical protein RHMOL_Rhmol08G0176900 [Rhododendron molle]|uniref:Uncharacterized protein n=1 Tax=Rhododendron molle TaxID=49168 RepID=A0ACC0MPL2_RHOML|nr:hypothetical protein RHMOL_Rhmol08G0176900 [Rhododendron molle]
MAALRTKYNVLESVGLELAPLRADRDVGSWDRMGIPIVAIVEGGVRFPLDPLLHRVLNWYRLTPMQVSTNFFRLVMGIVALNRILGTQLGIWDIQWWYSIVINPKYNTYYFKVRKADKRFMLNMPDSTRDHEMDFLYVTGAFEAMEEDGQVVGFHCPHIFKPVADNTNKRPRREPSYVRTAEINRILKYTGEPGTLRAGRGHDASVLLGYNPSYKGFIDRRLANPSTSATSTSTAPQPRNSRSNAGATIARQPGEIPISEGIPLSRVVVRRSSQR